MSSLEDIADAKIQAAVTRRLDALTPVIVSIRREMNDRNLLPSSIAVTKIHKKCISLFDEIRDDMKTEYGMVLDNAFWPRDALGDLLISKARRHLDTVTGRAQNEIENASQSLNSGIYKQLYQDIVEARDRAITDLSLFIDGHSYIQKQKKISKVAGFLPNILWKFFRS
jgi:hypothetical protein